MSKSKKLSPRLQKIADIIPRSEILADIGTDHAYLPRYLLQTEKIAKAILTDKNKGPLLIAQKNIQVAKLVEKVDFRQGDGLSPLKKGEVQTIVIAGMGGKLIQNILQETPAILDATKTLILQPMNNVEKLRFFLYQHDFYIAKETLAYEKGKIYQIILAKRGKKILPSPFSLKIGVNLEKDDKIFRQYLVKFQKKEEKILKSLKYAQQTVDIVAEIKKREHNLRTLTKYIQDI